MFLKFWEVIKYQVLKSSNLYTNVNKYNPSPCTQYLIVTSCLLKSFTGI